MAFHSGLMDLFPKSVGHGNASRQASGSPLTTTGLTMGYFDGNTVTALWNYAQHYAMSDNSFGSNFGPSTPGAINLISGQTNGVVDIRNGKGGVADGGNGSFTLISDPDHVLLDEPTLGLAPAMVDAVFDLIVELHQRGRTVLVVEQNALRVLEIADRGYVLRTGTIAAEGSGAELAAHEDLFGTYVG